MKLENKREYALKVLESVGIDREKANRRILKLSGGEQQRVAIARAISYNPDVILADEPTGNLDSHTEKQIIDIFKDLSMNKGKCVIIVTHSHSVADSADIIYELKKDKKEKKDNNDKNK